MPKYFITLLLIWGSFYLACRTKQAAPGASTTTAVQAQQPDSPPLNRFERAIEAFEAADQEGASNMGKIVFTGSSSIRMWKSLEQDMAPLQVLNRGFGGSTIPEVTHYAERIILPYRPRCIVLYGGDNDIVDEAVTPERVLETLKAYQANIQQHLPGTKTWFISIKPSPSRRHLLQKARQTNALVKAYTETDSLMAYIDVATPMMASEDKIRPDIFISDSLHMNASGYALWTPIVKAALMEGCR